MNNNSKINNYSKINPHCCLIKYYKYVSVVFKNNALFLGIIPFLSRAYSKWDISYYLLVFELKRANIFDIALTGSLFPFYDLSFYSIL